MEIVEVIVTGASEVTMPNNKILYFLTTIPDETTSDYNPTKRYGTTFKEYRCPKRIFYLALQQDFPYVAKLDLIDYDGKIKVSDFKLIKTID